MTDWSFPPDLQKKYDEVLATIRRLQSEFGIEPQTLEQRHQAYLKRQAEQQHRAEELAKLQAITGTRRPPPRWKV